MGKQPKWGEEHQMGTCSSSLPSNDAQGIDRIDSNTGMSGAPLREGASTASTGPAEKGQEEADNFTLAEPGL